MASSKKRKNEGYAGDPKRSSGERSETERSEGAPAESAPELPSPLDPEVSEKARRRRYTAEYKLRILQEADACRESGEIGALLRREGIYSSHLITWRRQRDEGALSGLKPKKRGRKAKEQNPLARRLAEVEKENQRLKKRLEKAEIIIEFQKKVADVLGIPLKDEESNESE